MSVEGVSDTVRCHGLWVWSVYVTCNSHGLGWGVVTRFSCEGCGAFIACVTAMIGSCYSCFTISCLDYRLRTAITHVIN